MQDIYSHEGYTSYIYGHPPSGHYPEHPDNDVDKALEMARKTYDELAKYGAKLKCCTPSPGENGNVEWDKAKQFLSQEQKGPDAFRGISDKVLEFNRQLLKDFTNRYVIPERCPNSTR